VAERPEADVVVTGSGLCCVGLLAWYDLDVVVLESHNRPRRRCTLLQLQVIKGFHFDSDPSLFSRFQLSFM
jgi:phytoene dehydrogenase-like protein